MLTAREIGRLHLCDRSAAKENRREKGGWKMRPCRGADRSLQHVAVWRRAGGILTLNTVAACQGLSRPSKWRHDRAVHLTSNVCKSKYDAYSLSHASGRHSSAATLLKSRYENLQ